jgi:hypothetical protein
MRAAPVGVDFGNRIVAAVTKAHGLGQQSVKHRLRDVRHARRFDAYAPDIGRHLGARHVMHHAVTAKLTEAVQHDSIGAFRRRLEIGEGRALQVLASERTDRARTLPRPALRRRFAERVLVRRHEFGRTRHPWQWHGLVAPLAEVTSHRSSAVAVALDVGQGEILGHVGRQHHASSHEDLPASSPGSLSNDKSKARMSHTFLPSI